tara:strand:- start:295 stop:660 length:366 start_codon:yes stop_codon:yes gene_type:complete
MASVIDFQNRFPEFSTVSDPRIQLFLDDVALILDNNESGIWLDFYDVAHSYYAAHLLVAAQNTEFGDSGTLAPISHQEVDDVVIKNAVDNIKPTADDLYSTSYGKRYVSYRRKVMPLIIGV